MATNPFEQFGPATAKPPVYGPPPKAAPAPTPIQEEDAKIKRDKAAREAAEWNATHNPDGTPKKGNSSERRARIKVALENLSDLESMVKASSGVGSIEGQEGYRSGTALGGLSRFFNQDANNVAGAIEMVQGDLINQIRLEMQDSGAPVGAKSSDTEKEAARLAASIANLSQTQDDAQFLIGVQRAREYYQRRLKELETGEVDTSDDSKVVIPPMAGGVPRSSDIQFGPEEGSFDADKWYQANYGITRNQAAQVEAVLNANRKSKGITASDLESAIAELGIPTEKIDFEGAAQRINSGEFEGASPKYGRFNFDVDSARKAREMELDAEIKARGVNPESAGRAALGHGLNEAALGGGDELMGIIAGLATAMRGQGFEQGYTSERDITRRKLERSAAENPTTALLSGLAGGLLNPVGVNKFRAASSIADVAKAGAQLGAVSGFLHGEGPVGSVGNAMAGAALGAPLSAGTHAAGQAIVNRFPQLLNRQANQAAQRMAAEEVVAAGEATGVPVRMADVRPELAGQRAQAKASQYGGDMVARAEEADLGAMENAMLKLGGGNITRDPFAAGQVIQRGLENQAERSKALRDNTYDLVRKLSGTPERVKNEAGETVIKYHDFKANPVQTVAAIDAAIESLRASAPRGSDEVVRALEKVRNDFAETGLSTASLQAQREVVRGLTNQTSIDMTRAEAILGNVLKIAGQELVGAMKGAGKTRAAQALEKANKDTAIYHDFRREVAKRLLGPDNQPLSPERTASAIEGWLKPGVSGDFERVSRVWKELSPPDRADFASAVASNMGRSRDGTFSLKLLINNLDSKNGMLSPRSAEMIFGREGVAALRNLKKLAEAKVVSQSGTNTSRTANVMGPQIGGLRRMMLSLLGLGAGDVTGAGAAYAADTFISRIGEKRLARLVTDTNVVKWIESLPETADGVSVSKALARLDSIAARSPAIAADIALLRDEVKRTRSAPIPARTQ